MSWTLSRVGNACVSMEMSNHRPNDLGRDQREEASIHALPARKARRQRAMDLVRGSLCRGSFALLIAVASFAARPCAATEAPPPDATTREASVSPKTKMALKMAGLVTFVASSCPELQPDYTRFKRALGALGVSTADLETVQLRGMYLSYALRYKEATAANCARALKDFGPGGSVIADLVRQKDKAPDH